VNQPPQPHQPRHYKTWFKRAFFTLVTLLAAALLFYVFVVPPITVWAIQRALAAAGLSNATYELRSVTLTSLDIVNVHVIQDDPSTIGAVAIDYTPWTLLKGQVNTVRLIGAELNIAIKNGKIDYGGLNPLLNPIPTTQPASPPLTPGAPPKDENLWTLPVQQVTLEASSLVVDIHGWKARLAASGSIKKIDAAPKPMFDEPIVRAIPQHVAIDFKIDSALVPAYVTGWIAPDIDDADFLIHLGPKLDPNPANPTTQPFIQAQLSVRETPDGPTYRTTINATSGMASSLAAGKPPDNYAGLEFDARFGPGFALKSLTGSAQLSNLNFGFGSLDFLAKFEAKDGRLAVTSSKFKLSGPEGLAIDANLSLDNIALSLPIGSTSKNRLLQASSDIAFGVTAKPAIPAALTHILGNTIDLRVGARGSLSASYSLDTHQYRAQASAQRAWLSAKPQASPFLGALDIRAQNITLSNDNNGTDFTLAGLLLWATQPGVAIPDRDIETALLPPGAAMLQLGRPDTPSASLRFHKPADGKPPTFSLGRAVVRARYLLNFENNGVHSADLRIRLPLGVALNPDTGAPILTIPVAPLASAPVPTTAPSDTPFLPTDRPRLQWLISSPYLALPDSPNINNSIAGAVEVKGTGPIVVRLPAKSPDSSAQWLRETRIDPTSLQVVTGIPDEDLPPPAPSTQPSNRATAQSTTPAPTTAPAPLRNYKSSRISFSGPSTLLIDIQPQSPSAPLNATTFKTKLLVPTFTTHLSATDSVTGALTFTADITPQLTPPAKGQPESLAVTLTPDLTLDLQSAILPTYGVQGLSGRLQLSSQIQLTPDTTTIIGAVKLTSLNLSLPKQEVTLTNTSLHIPIATRLQAGKWVLPTTDASLGNGEINIPSLTYKNQALPPITGSAAFLGSDFKSSINWQPLQGAKLNIATTATVTPIFKAKVLITLPAFNSTSPLAIAQFLEKLGVTRTATSEITGTFAAKATILYQDEKLTGDGEVQVTNVDVSDRIAAAEVKGLSGKIILAQLLPLRSQGGQRITAKSIKLNEILLDNADVTLTIESPQTFLIERTRAQLGEQGILGLTAFRYTIGKTDINTDLLLEDVNIKDLFTAFAKAKLEGEGGLWGRVPIIIAPGSPQPLVIREGFLFARPGDVGWFKILDPATTNTIDSIADGVAVDQAIQGKSVENARDGIKGLKNFSYDKLTVNFERKNGKTIAVIRASGKGRGLGPLVPPLVPTITVENIDQALGTALNYWYQWTKPQGPPPAPSPLDDLF
jgi:hypothetical protein